MTAKTFFENYGKSFLDAKKLAAFYCDFAIASTPSFVGNLRGKDEINSAMKSVADMNKNSGMTSLTPESVEVTKIDALHDWVKVKWAATFTKSGGISVEFENSYLLRREQESFKILLYIAHQDEQMLRQDLELT